MKIKSISSKLLNVGVFFSLSFLMTLISFSQPSWPLLSKENKTEITVFKPVVESFNNNTLSFRAAISVVQNNDTPVFGAIWGNAQLEHNASTRITKILSIAITDLRFPDGVDATEKAELIQQIQRSFDNDKPRLSMDDILADLDDAKKESMFTSQINNNPPKIIYTSEASLLVTIDGEPEIGNTSERLI